MFGFALGGFAIFELLWAGVRLVFWFAALVIVTVIRVLLAFYDAVAATTWRRDPADHPDWWAARLAEHPAGRWQA